MSCQKDIAEDSAEDIAKDVVKPAAFGGAAHIVSPDARVAAGKALRDRIPREQHGRWNGAKERDNPIDLLHESDADRMKELIALRYGRMVQSPLAFYRGPAGVMAADLARTPTTGLTVQACGDCHLLNFGGFATPERSIIFDINDFDETPGPNWSTATGSSMSPSRWSVSAAWAAGAGSP